MDFGWATNDLSGWLVSLMSILRTLRNPSATTDISRKICHIVLWTHKVMTLLVAAHLLIPVIFKALNGEGPGHLLKCPFAVLHPVETIEVICLLLCEHSYLTWPSGTGAWAGKMGTPSIPPVLCKAGCLSKGAFLFFLSFFISLPLFLEENKLG